MRKRRPNVTADGELTGAPSHAEGPTSGSAPHEILDFLATAPPSVRAWAQAQSNAIRAITGPVEQPEEPNAMLTAEVQDPADLALAEIGEHDDEGHRAPKVFTPQDRPEPQSATRSRPKILLPVLGVLLVAATVFGIYWSGLPQSPPPQQSGASQTDPAARIAELERVIQDDPNNVNATLELGVLVFKQGNVERAEQLWTKVTSIDPKNPQGWFNLGFVHISKKPPNTEAARKAWDKVLELAPDSDLAKSIQNHLGALDNQSASPSVTPTATPR